ncbi:Aldo reductase [Apiospora arundinis]
MAPPQIIFGTATFGFPNSAFQDAEAVSELLRTLRDLGVTRLDAAARYPPNSPGRAEELIGEATKEEAGSGASAFLIDTKIMTDVSNDGSGDLAREAIEASSAASLQRLQRPEGVNVLHIHRADPTTPLEEQLQSLHDQVSQGHCKAWGVSNVPPATLEKMLQLCDQKGWTRPICYQGPSLAAGFLTGKLVNNEYAGTRFGDDHPYGQRIRQMFGGADLTGAMQKFDAEVKAQGLSSTEVAYRWLAYHSALGEGDGIIIGASRLEQVVETVGIIRHGPLPDAVVSLASELWEAVRGTRGEIV